MGNRTVLDYRSYGFKGTYWESGSSDRAIIVLMGDTDGDIMNRAASKWLTRFHDVNALSLSLITEDDEEGGMHSWPIERIESAVTYLVEEKKMTKVGLLGISMQSALALAAASLIPGISLVIAFAPSDYVPWGFYQGKLGKYRHAEWPSCTSAFSWRGKDLEHLPSVYGKEEYYQHYLDEKKKWGETHTESFFTESEEKAGIPDGAYIRVEDIDGRVVLVGCEDDSMWNTTRHIGRIRERLLRLGKAEKLSTLVYGRGTHLLLPEKMLRTVLPIGASLVSGMYQSGKNHKKECKASRLDLDTQLELVLSAW